MGGGTSCAGKAISFSANTPQNNDPAKSRVMIDFKGSSDLPLGNAARTIEFWAFIKSSSWAGDANTMFEYGVVASNQGFGLDFGGQKSGNMGTLDPYTNGSFDNDNQNSGLDSRMDQWAHLALTYDGSAVVLYVNGVEKARKTSNGNMLNTMTSQLTIGGNPRGSYFNGSIDEFRIWNIARSASDITGTLHKALSGNETGLVAYFKFDEGSGTAAADSTTGAGHTKHDGTLMASSSNQVPEWVPSTAPLECP
jgi:hypothetical protein